MASALEDAEEDEAGGDGSVENTQEDQGRNHERKGNLLVQLIAQRTESGSGVVLRSGISVDNSTDQAEDNDFRNCNRPKSFREVFGVLHLSDEAGKGDLANEGIANVQIGTHTTDKSGASARNHENNRFADHTQLWTFCDPYASVVVVRVVLNPCKYGCQQDGNEGEERGKSCQFRKGVEGPGQRAKEAYDCHDCGEADGAYAAIGHRVEILCAGYNV